MNDSVGNHSIWTTQRRKKTVANSSARGYIGLVAYKVVALSRVRVVPCLHLETAGEEETVPTGTCPECDADVHVDLDTDKGEIVSCEECGTELEVVGLDPVELDIVEEESLDEDEDEDEY